MKRRDCLKAGAAIFIGSAAMREPLAQPAMTGTHTMSRQLRFTVSVINPKPHGLRDQRLWLYAPAAESPTQQLAALTVSMPHERLSDGFGHTIVKLDFPDFPPLATKVVAITADLLLTNEPVPAPLGNPHGWLAAERFVESDDGRIRALAAKLRHSDESDTGKAIYGWVSQNLRYTGYAADPRGALGALLDEGGDCTEYACLSVALARANGIPARWVSGYVIARDSVLRPADYHDWAEVYFGGAWRLLDAQKGHWLGPAEQYVAFRYGQDQVPNPIGSAQRFRVQGELEVKLM